MNKKIIRIALFIAIDFCTVYMLMGLSYLIRLYFVYFGFLDSMNISWCYFAANIWWMGGLFIAFAFYEGLYTKRRIFWEEARLIARSVTLWAVVVAAILALTRTIDTFSRMVLILMWLFGLVLIPLAHYWGKKLLIRLGFYHAPMLIIGAGGTGISAAEGILSQPYLGYDIVGFLDDDPTKQQRSIPYKTRSLEVLGTLDMMEQIIQRYNVKTVLIAIPSLSAEQLTHITNTAHHLVKRIMIIPDIKGVSLTNAELHYLFDQQLFMLKLSNNLASAVNIGIKRLFDLVVSFLALPILLPFFLIIGTAIRLESKGPVFFRQPRIGQGGKPFLCYKFRTMYTNSDTILATHLEKHPDAKAEWEEFRKLRGHDPRVTRVGSFLRKTSLDELSQLLNVFKGDMSLVGARPYMLEERERMGALYDTIIEATPGITGLWQVSGRNALSFENRVALDAWYVLNWSLWLDIIILFKTIKVVLKREGAY